MPCTEKRARQLLQRKKAVVDKIFPFTIRLKDHISGQVNLQPLRLKLDPGSKTTGTAILNEGVFPVRAIWLGEIKHKQGINDKLDTRRGVRKSRRSRKTRYRIKRFSHRTREDGWLPPSLMARVEQTIHAVNKLRKLLPITAVSTEHVKFDTQLMTNPDIQGISYQQGELFGYEAKEYLLEKFGHQCAYCGKTDTPLEVEHMLPRNPVQCT